jgi:hypothetical protein
MTNQSTSSMTEALAASGLPDEQIKLALKTSADLRALLTGMPEDHRDQIPGYRGSQNG